MIRKHVANEDINLEYINTKNQLADIFTKLLRENRFCSLRRELGVFAFESWMLCLNFWSWLKMILQEYCIGFNHRRMIKIAWVSKDSLPPLDS